MTSGSDFLISKLTIRFFKSIADQEIPLGNVNAFIGANGSGKSNVLEALGVLSAAASGRVDDEALQRRGVRPGVPRLYKSAFRNEHISPNISFQAESDFASYSVSLNNPLEAPRPAWWFKTEELKSGDQTIESRGPRSAAQRGSAKNPEQGLVALRTVEIAESDPTSRLLSALREYSIYAPYTPVLRGIEPDRQSRDPVGLSGGRLAEAVQELKQQARGSELIAGALEELIEMIGWVKTIDATSATENLLSSSVSRPRSVLRFTDRFMREGKNTLSAYDASEGALYVLFCAVLALSPKAPKCMAIDNLDQALNPRLVQRLIGSLCRWIVDNPVRRQVLFTVHNPSALDGLEPPSIGV